MGRTYEKAIAANRLHAALAAAFVPDYVVELKPSLGVRGGALAADYAYFRGGEHLTRNAVDAISL